MIRVINIPAAPATPTAEGSVRTVLSQASDGTRVEVAVNEIDPGRSLHLEPGPRTRVAYLLEGKDATIALTRGEQTTTHFTQRRAGLYLEPVSYTHLRAHETPE